MPKLTEQTILDCRQWFADNADACIEDAVSGKVFVNDLNKYTQDMIKRKCEALAGDYDHTFTFLQRATWMQTGECHALLP
tara:strand:+ start:85843 stop:86082 length:240 start_codon:yes stop_codon:yes gene_type:complete